MTVLRVRIRVEDEPILSLIEASGLTVSEALRRGLKLLAESRELAVPVDPVLVPCGDCGLVGGYHLVKCAFAPAPGRVPQLNRASKFEVGGLVRVGSRQILDNETGAGA